MKKTIFSLLLALSISDYSFSGQIGFKFHGFLYSTGQLPKQRPAACPEKVYRYFSGTNPQNGLPYYGQCTYKYLPIPQFNILPNSAFRLVLNKSELTYLVSPDSNSLERLFSGGKMTLQVLDTSFIWKSALISQNTSIYSLKKCGDTTRAWISGTITGGDSLMMAAYYSVYGNNQFRGIVKFINISGAGVFEYNLDVFPTPLTQNLTSTQIPGKDSTLNFANTNTSLSFDSLPPGFNPDSSKATVVLFNGEPTFVPSADTIATIFNNNYWSIGTTVDSFSVNVCFTFDSSTFNTNRLDLLSCVYQDYENAPWKIINSKPTITGNKICFITDHLSNWAIAITKPEAKAVSDTTLFNNTSQTKDISYQIPNTAIELSSRLTAGQKDTVLFYEYDINPGGDLPPGIKSINNVFWDYTTEARTKKVTNFDLTKIQGSETTGFSRILYRPGSASDWQNIPSTRVKKSLKEHLYIKIDTILYGQLCLSIADTQMAAFNCVSNVADACPGTPSKFSATVSNGLAPYTYKWIGDDGFASDSSSPSFIFPSGTGLYNFSVSVTDETGASTDFSGQARVLSLPKAGFTYSINGQSVTVVDTSKNAKTVTWNFGDGTIVNTVTTHNYSNPGTYYIDQIVSNDCKKDSLRVSITTGLDENKIELFHFTIEPNPVTDQTYLHYFLKNKNYVSIEIYNCIGQKTSSVLNKTQENGEYKIPLNINNKTKNESSNPGIYFIKIQIGNKIINKRIIVLEK